MISHESRDTYNAAADWDPSILGDYSASTFFSGYLQMNRENKNLYPFKSLLIVTTLNYDICF